MLKIYFMVPKNHEKCVKIYHVNKYAFALRLNTPFYKEC